MNSTTRFQVDGVSQNFHASPQSLRYAQDHEASESSILHSGDMAVIQHEMTKHHQRCAHLEKVFIKLEQRLDELYEFLPQAKMRNSFLNSLRASAINSDTISNTAPHQDHTPTTSISDPRGSPEVPASMTWDALAPHTARLDAIEASCGDLRHSVQDALSVAESTERLLKAVLDHEAGQLRHELGNDRVQLAADIRRVEAAGGEASRRVQEIERRVEEARQDQLASTSSLNARMERAMRSIGEHSTEVGHLHAMLKGELMQEFGALRESMELEFAKVKQNAEGLGQTEVASQNNCIAEESNSRIKELELKHAADVASVQHHLQELERMQVQQQQAGTGSEVSVATRLEQQLKEIVQPHLDMLLNATARRPNSSDDIQELLMRLAALEIKTLHGNASEISSSLATSSDVDHLRGLLANTEQEVSRLAQSVAGVVEAALSRDMKLAETASPCGEATSPSGGKDALEIQLQRISGDLSTRLTTTENNFTCDLQHVRELLTSCLSLHRTTHEDIQDLRPRVRSLEDQIVVGFQLRPSSQVPLQPQQQQQQQQQVAKVPAWARTQRLDASNVPVSILTNHQTLVRAQSQDLPANAARPRSQPAPCYVTTVDEAKTQLRSPTAPVAMPAQHRSSSRVFHLPQDGSTGPHGTEGRATSILEAMQANIAPKNVSAGPSKRGSFSLPTAGSKAVSVLNITGSAQVSSPGSLKASPAASPYRTTPRVLTARPTTCASIAALR